MGSGVRVGARAFCRVICCDVYDLRMPGLVVTGGASAELNECKCARVCRRTKKKACLHYVLTTAIGLAHKVSN